MPSFSRFMEMADDKLHDAKRSIFGSSKAKQMQDTYDTSDFGATDVEPGDFAQGEGALIAADRGLLRPEMITQSPGFERIAHNRDVQSILGKLYAFRQTMASKTLPRATADTQAFKTELAQAVGGTVMSLQTLQEDLAQGAETLNSKTGRYRTVAAICASGAVRTKEQINLCNRILERGLLYAEKGYPGSIDPTSPIKFPEGASMEAALLDPSFAYMATYGEEDFQGVVGSGGINSVKKVTEGGQTRVFKEGGVHLTGETAVQQESITSVVERMEVTPMVGQEGGYERASKREINSSYRDAAVSVVDRLFGLKAAVGTSLARTSEHGGRQASVMDLAEGRTANGILGYFGAEEERFLRAQQEIDKLLLDLKFEGKTEEEQAMLRQDPNVGNLQTSASQKLVDLNSDRMMQSAMNMAVLDIIVGHVDRHNGNFMVSEAGDLTGIDNDTAFSLRESFGVLGGTLDERKSSYEERQPIVKKAIRGFRTAEGVDLQNDTSALQAFDTNLPVITSELRTKILSVAPDTLASALRGLVGEPQIQAAVGRLKALQDYVSKMPPEKVKKPDEGFTEEEREAFVYNHEGSRTVGNYLAQMHIIASQNLKSTDPGSLTSVIDHLKKQPYLRDYIEEHSAVLSPIAQPYSMAKYMREDIYKLFEEDPNFDIKQAYESGELMYFVRHLLEKYVSEHDQGIE
ncbi:MAG: hypothetical protein K6E81_03300 [Lachnospiraceae bacterium]|nr:hypothetical protein [Lachnospiraceae bacterium]